MVQKILAKKTDHVVVEPQARMCETLETNKRQHGSGYFVAKGALSKSDMYLRPSRNLAHRS